MTLWTAGVAISTPGVQNVMRRSTDENFTEFLSELSQRVPLGLPQLDEIQLLELIYTVRMYRYVN